MNETNIERAMQRAAIASRHAKEASELAMLANEHAETLNKRFVGTANEEKAREFLIKNGYTIMCINYSCKIGEIDVVAMDNKYICFIEVKYRNSAVSGYAEEAVNERKQKKIRLVAQHYIASKEFSTDRPYRFDVVAINDDEITLIKDAFSLN